MDGAADRTDDIVDTNASDLLLRHCLALGAVPQPKTPVRQRLEAEIGPDLTRRLLTSLTNVDRR